MTLARDLQLAVNAKRHGANYSLRIIREARREGVPVSWAFALFEQETGFRNVFGHDKGGMYPGQPVTKGKVLAMLRYTAAGGNSNGVGPGQLTYPPLIRRANQAGGAWKPAVNIRVSLRFFREITRGNYELDAWKYNGGPAYQKQIKAKQRAWHRILT